jgi:transcriptional regulator with XRE-family HTH domain
MGSSTALGQYLRARRELVRPEDVSLPNVGRRRVPGLRREELAMLAGISSDYYLRLEQGRDHHPSAHVIDALARALQLDEDATAHLPPSTILVLTSWWASCRCAVLGSGACGRP